MANLVRIPVPGGIRTHAGVISEVVLREPSFDEFVELGEVTSWGRSPEGFIFPVENPETLRSYIAKCLVQPQDPLLLGQGGVRLAKAVKGAVLGFFRDEPSAAEPSPTSPTTSSSNASPDASPPTPSGA